MGTPEWVSSTLRRLNSANEVNRRVVKRRKRKIPTGEMGGQAGMVYESRVVEGMPRIVQLGLDKRVNITTSARVVVTSDGEVATVSGSSGAPITIRELGKVAPELSPAVKNSLRRARKQIITKLRV